MKIILPEHWQFETEIAVRITDLNYGNHLANQNILAYAQEARVRYFRSYGFTELDFGGQSLIQADAAVIFKGESFYADQLKIQVSAVATGSSSFNVYYLINNQKGNAIAEVRTALVCFDYSSKKPVRIPQKVLDSGIFLSKI